MLVYSAAELKEAHEPYATEAAMAKMYASDIALEVTNDALQIFGGTGFLKGMDVERMYRDAKITTIYEGTNEIQRVVISSNILGKPPKSEGGSSSRPKKPAPVTGVRKRQILGRVAWRRKRCCAALVAALQKDGHDFTVGIPIDTPITQAERVVSAGQGIGSKEHMKLVEDLARAAGAAVGSSRPVAETSNMCRLTAMSACPARSSRATCTSPAYLGRDPAPHGYQGRLDHRGDQQEWKRAHLQKL